MILINDKAWPGILFQCIIYYNISVSLRVHFSILETLKSFYFMTFSITVTFFPEEGLNSFLQMFF